MSRGPGLCDTPTPAPGAVDHWVYGVVEARADRLPPDLRGIDDAPVELLALGELAAVVGAVATERRSGRRADLMAHSRVLDALAATGAVVPVQFGSVLADRTSIVEEVLAPRAPDFAELLAQLTGRAQFNVRASYVEDVVLTDIVATDPTVAALRERTRRLPEDAGHAERVRLGELVSRAVDDRRAYDAEVLLATVLPFTAAHRVTLGTGLERIMDVSVLVDDDRRTGFEDQLEQLAEAVHESIRLRLVGPVAPYDFVGDV